MMFRKLLAATALISVFGVQAASAETINMAKSSIKLNLFIIIIQ